MPVSTDTSFVGADGYGFPSAPADGISHKNATTTTISCGGTDYDFGATGATIPNLTVTSTLNGPAPVYISTTGTTTMAVIASDAGKLFTNETGAGAAATGIVTYTLPTGVSAGSVFNFVTATGGGTPIRVAPSGSDRIYMVTGTTTLSTGYITSNLNARTQSYSIALVYMGNGKWRPISGYSFDWSVV